MSENSASITPHLVCRDANQAIEFYQKAFGARPGCVHRMPDGKVMHAALTVGNSMLFLCDEFPDYGSNSPQALGGTPITLHLQVDRCDDWFQRAVDAGCTVRMPLADQFWGDRYGMVACPYGHLWSISTHVRDVSPEELQKAALEMTPSCA